MKDLATIHDPVFTGRNDYSALDRFFLSLIRDERDLPFIYLSLKITLIMIPTGLALYFTSSYLFVLLAVVYFALNNFAFKGPFGLMLHCTSHRKWFKSEYEWLNKYLPWVVGPFFGQKWLNVQYRSNTINANKNGGLLSLFLLALLPLYQVCRR